MNTYRKKNLSREMRTAEDIIGSIRDSFDSILRENKKLTSQLKSLDRNGELESYCMDRFSQYVDDVEVAEDRFYEFEMSVIDSKYVESYQMTEGISSFLRSNGIYDNGSELQVQVDRSSVSVVSANTGDSLVVLFADTSYTNTISLDDRFEGESSARGVRPFSFALECTDKRDVLKTFDKVWDAISDVIDLDDEDYSIDQINSQIPKIARRFGFEK